MIDNTFSALLGRPSQEGVWRSARDSIHFKKWSLLVPSGIVMCRCSAPMSTLATKAKSLSKLRGVKSFSRKECSRRWSKSLSILPP